ncbi:(Fe-S)-binding protein [Conexibacter arvalis]|uniref:Glycolate oxidase iron-sulfur subunit n=1 Tax=Conexibacter arvalis TaxID=912552 RepID=A0A840IIS9_9ACTN|nr:(Fe-S)-binding protein [Conexibacter arvalis]MBB4664882.1 glycolate oxidase iron-sulfur subunit [Conexibacter arvalis]
MAGFDLVRRPEPELIEACVHCGFCLPTCPTYVLWGEEVDSPRGRILLMRAAEEEGGELTVAQVDAWDNCLGCMACVTACPSGVQYDNLIEDARAQVERNWERSRADRLWRQALFALFPHPGRLRALAPFAAVARLRPPAAVVARLRALRPRAAAARLRQPPRVVARLRALRPPAAARLRPPPQLVARLRAFPPLAAAASARPVERFAARLTAPVKRLAARLTAPLERLAACLAASLARPRALLRLAPRTPLRATIRRLPERTAPRTPRRGRVGFVQGCVQRVFFGEVNAATVAVLAAEGYEVFAPRLPRCCGALQLHSGDADPARRLARETIATFEGCDAVVANAAGCGSAMKEYGHLLRDDPAWAERARAFSAKVRDATELLAEQEPRAVRHPLELTVAYHDACHLAHAQGVREAPRALLRQIPGLELREPAGWEICCGSAGLYNLLEPEPAAELGRRKAELLLATGADVVAAANPGCALQLAAHARSLGRDLEVRHPIELIAASISGTPLRP